LKRKIGRLAAAMVAGVALLAGAAVTSTVLADTSPNQSAGPTPRDAQTAVLAAFDRYQIVAGDSPVDFWLDLIRNPGVPDKVNDIAVECGNSRYQPVLDRYIAGKDVPLAEVRQVWRNTTQPSCGFSTFYETLFPLVRRINEKLPAEKKLRVLACDPPIDWSTITGPQGLAPYSDRDAFIATVIKEQVLAKHRRALMLFGVRHLTHGQGEGSAVAMYEKTYPNVTFTIAAHDGFAKDNDVLEKRMASWPVPALAPMKRTWLGSLDDTYFDRPIAYPAVDAYLYTGPRDHLLRQTISARTVLDKDYVAELERRATVIHAPPDSLAHPEVIFQRELESSVLAYDPK
jgi:hypothetical protein